VNFDPSKRSINLRKHQIDLVRCAAIFDHPMLTREDSRDTYGEERLLSLGLLDGHVVMLVWTDEYDGPRFISCRRATSYEQQAYFRAFPA
jgi:uncharacterized DUF497 family protein